MSVFYGKTKPVFAGPIAANDPVVIKMGKCNKANVIVTYASAVSTNSVKLSKSADGATAELLNSTIEDGRAEYFIEATVAGNYLHLEVPADANAVVMLGNCRTDPDQLYRIDFATHCGTPCGEDDGSNNVPNNTPSTCCKITDENNCGNNPGSFTSVSGIGLTTVNGPFASLAAMTQALRDAGWPVSSTENVTYDDTVTPAVFKFPWLGPCQGDVTISCSTGGVVATPDTLNLNADGTLGTVNLLTNDSNPDGTGGLAVTHFESNPVPSSGSINVSKNGITYSVDATGQVAATAISATPGTYTCTYSITDADGHAASSTLTTTVVAPPPAASIHFFQDGDAGETNVGATDVKTAITNGDPLAITDGSGDGQTMLNPVTLAGLEAWAVTTYGAGSTVDAATCDVTPADGSTANIAICTTVTKQGGHVRTQTGGFSPTYTQDADNLGGVWQDSAHNSTVRLNVLNGAELETPSGAAANHGANTETGTGTSAMEVLQVEWVFDRGSIDGFNDLAAFLPSIGDWDNPPDNIDSNVNSATPIFESPGFGGAVNLRPSGGGTVPTAAGTDAWTFTPDADPDTSQGFHMHFTDDPAIFAATGQWANSLPVPAAAISATARHFVTNVGGDIIGYQAFMLVFPAASRDVICGLPLSANSWTDSTGAARTDAEVTVQP